MVHPRKGKLFRSLVFLASKKKKKGGHGRYPGQKKEAPARCLQTRGRGLSTLSGNDLNRGQGKKWAQLIRTSDAIQRGGTRSQKTHQKEKKPTLLQGYPKAHGPACGTGREKWNHCGGVGRSEEEEGEINQAPSSKRGQVKGGKGEKKKRAFKMLSHPRSLVYPPWVIDRGGCKSGRREVG